MLHFEGTCIALALLLKIGVFFQVFLCLLLEERTSEIFTVVNMVIFSSSVLTDSKLNPIFGGSCIINTIRYVIFHSQVIT